MAHTQDRPKGAAGSVRDGQDSRKLGNSQTARERARLIPSQGEEETCSSPSSSRKTRARRLERHSFPLWLVSSYSLVVLVSWILTCILSFRPLQLGSYYDQTGKTTQLQYRINDRWRVAARTLNSVTSTLTIPITSALCAKAAVIYTQRRSRETPVITLSRTLALADRGWTDLDTLISLLTPHGIRRVGSPLLVFAAVLTGIGLTLQPLQQILLRTENVRVLTCQGDDAYCSINHKGQSIGPDPELDQIATVPLINVVTEAAGNMILANGDAYQSQLWADTTVNSLNNRLVELLVSNDLSVVGEQENPSAFPFFVSSYSNGTNTGVFREHALRLNSSLICTNQTSFPDQCQGDSPFKVSYSGRVEKRPSYWQSFNYQVCLPGDYTASPWNLTRNRQDIFEDLYMKFEAWNEPPNETSFMYVNATYRCTANTTRGYFELPNIWNDNAAGDLLTKWPSKKETSQTFNDPDGHSDETFKARLGYRLPVPVGTTYGSNTSNAYYNTPGPLGAAALALFGNTSFFASAASALTSGADEETVCRSLRVPFGHKYTLLNLKWKATPLACNVGTRLTDILAEWLANFENPDKTRYALGASIFFASQATLNQAVVSSSAPPRELFTDPGYPISRLRISVPAMVSLSALILVQLAGLFALAFYAYKPSWTKSLDSFAILRLGASMADDVPLISSIESKEVQELTRREGWIGAVVEEEEKGSGTLVIGGESPLESKVQYRLDRELSKNTG